MDEDEHVIISDRLKELIKYKGFQVMLIKTFTTPINKVIFTQCTVEPYV